MAKALTRTPAEIVLLSGLTALFMMLVLSGCNTVEGMGEDVSAAGGAVSDTADDVEDEMYSWGPAHRLTDLDISRSVRSARRSLGGSGRSGPIGAGPRRARQLRSALTCASPGAPALCLPRAPSIFQ